MKASDANKLGIPMKNNLMVDVEALRLNQPWKAPLLQIGVAVFTPFGSVVYSGKIFINQDAQPIDVSPEASTVVWWNDPKRDKVWSNIVEQCETNGVDPEEALVWLNKVYEGFNCGSIWFAGPQYDKTILDNYSEICAVPPAWNYDDVRCFRTIRKQHPDVLENWNYDGYDHDAEHDALDQVARLRAITDKKEIVWL